MASSSPSGPIKMISEREIDIMPILRNAAFMRRMEDEIISRVSAAISDKIIKILGER